MTFLKALPGRSRAPIVREIRTRGYVGTVAGALAGIEWSI